MVNRRTDQGCPDAGGGRGCWTCIGGDRQVGHSGSLDPQLRLADLDHVAGAHAGFAGG